MKSERYIWVLVVGLILGLLSYQSCDNKRLKAKVTEATMQADAWRVMAQTLKCDTVLDTAWKAGPVIRKFRTVTDTIYLSDAGPCPSNTYQDTIHFDGADFGYKIKTNGTLEELEPYLKIYAPQIVTIPVAGPCPPAPMPIKEPKWSVNIAMGFPLCGYMGADYAITPAFAVTGGAFVAPKSANLLIGVRIRAGK